MRNLKKSVTHLLKRAGILSSLALCMTPVVQAEEFKDCLIVHLHGGSTVSYVLEDTPVVTFVGENLHVEADQLSDDHKLANVEKFTFDNVAALADVMANEYRITIQDNYVTIEGLTPNTGIQLADIQGRIIASCNADTEGNATLSLSHITAGVYIVSTTDGKSFKIFKK